MSLKKESSGFIAQERLFLTADGKIVHEGDHRAAQLLAPKGGHIPEKLAKRLKLESAKVEPLETGAQAKLGFDGTKSEGGFHVEHKKTVAPETIAERSTRPEEPKRTR